MKKKLLFIFRQTPHGGAIAQEALDVLLMASTYRKEINLVFLDDGVFQLTKQQDTSKIALKNFTSAYAALTLYDINQIHIAADALAERNLTVSDLMLPVTVLTRLQIAQLMQNHDLILNF